MTAIAEGFVFGLGSSVHCAAMCGPLVLAAGGGRGQLAAYHGGRLTGYVVAGGVLGAVGATSGAGLLREASPWLALLLAAGLLGLAGGLDRFLGAIPGAGRVVRATLGRARRWPASARSAALGGVTPLLPCGVLWVLYGGCLLSGSGTAGASTTLGFALGSAPLLALAQFHGGWLRRRLSPACARLVARLVLVSAAAVLAWRAFAGLAGESCCGAAG